GPRPPCPRVSPSSSQETALALVSLFDQERAAPAQLHPVVQHQDAPFPADSDNQGDLVGGQVTAGWVVIALARTVPAPAPQGRPPVPVHQVAWGDGLRSPVRHCPRTRCRPSPALIAS